MTDSFVPHNFHTVGFGITGDRDATRLMANQLDEGVATRWCLPCQLPCFNAANSRRSARISSNRAVAKSESFQLLQTTFIPAKTCTWRR